MTKRSSKAKTFFNQMQLSNHFLKNSKKRRSTKTLYKYNKINSKSSTIDDKDNVEINDNNQNQDELHDNDNQSDNNDQDDNDFIISHHDVMNDNDNIITVTNNDDEKNNDEKNDEYDEKRNDDNDFSDIDNIDNNDPLMNNTSDQYKYTIYKIVDKFNHNQFYIGSTKNYSSRKSKHKKNVKNTCGKNYWCKLYQYIRRHGGWNNFKMTILKIGYSNTNKKIKILEQKFIDIFQPTLNTNASFKLKNNSHNVIDDYDHNYHCSSDNDKNYNTHELIHQDILTNIVSPKKETTNNTIKLFNTFQTETEVTEYYITKQIEEIKCLGRSKFILKKNINTTSPTKTRNRAANIDIEINEDIAKELRYANQLHYVRKSSQSKEAFIQQNLQFLSWILDNNCNKRNMNLLKLIKYVVDNTNLLDDWYNYLHDSKKMSYDTIRGRFNNVSVLIQLFNSSLSKKKDNAVEKCIQYCRIITRRCEYDVIDSLSQISTTDYINKGLLPKNLKSDLLKMWKMLLPLINNIIQLSKSITLRKKNYSLLLKCLLFGFWAENSNGRMKAVVTMTIEQYKHMCRKNYNSSNQTKTIKQHGRQLVSLCSNSELLTYLKMYVTQVRPQILHNNNDKEYVFLK
jgi:hypothetical protein